MKTSKHYLGEACVLLTCIVEGFFPVVTNYLAPNLPSLLFVNGAHLTTVLFMAVILIFKGNLFNKVPYKAIYFIFINAFVTSFYYLSIVYGTRFTSGISTALILKTEMLTMFLFAWFFLKERMSAHQYAGMITVIMGIIMVLFNGTFEVNKGDLIMLSTVVFLPVANHCAKLALNKAGVALVIFWRFLFSFLILLPFNLFTIQYIDQALISWQLLWFILAYGVLFFGGQNIIWYTGLKLMQLDRAVYIICASPAFSLLFALVLFKEIPTVYQMIGFVFTLVGIYLLIIKKKLVEPILE